MILTHRNHVFEYSLLPAHIKQLAGIPLSKTNSEDVDTKAEDHAYDAFVTW
jgi:hypothetical protein